MAAEAQLLFDLFDTNWFSNQILKRPQTPPPQIHENEESVAQNLDFSSVPTINVRSYSDEMFINSPISVLNLQTPKVEAKTLEENEIKLPVKEKNTRGGRRRKHNLVRCKSKSLSELEFEEVKGFMDLGFLFSEKDKDSSLVSVIPGLQRLGKDEKDQQVHDYVNVSRPYLSEAWGDLEKMRMEAPKLISIPVIGNEADVKNQLRFWAHSVASVVR